MLNLAIDIRSNRELSHFYPTVCSLPNKYFYFYVVYSGLWTAIPTVSHCHIKMKNIDTKMDVNLNRGVHVNSIQQTIFRESLSRKSKSSFRKYLHFCILEVGGMYLDQCNVKFHFISD